MPHEFSIPVDVTNAGQFYACCGLLELATATQPDRDVLGHFGDGVFVMTTDPRDALQALIDGTLDVEPPNENSLRIRGGAAHKVAPIRVNGKLLLDWWLDDSAGDVKTWAGGMVAPDSAKAMQTSLRGVDLGGRPFDFAAASTAAAFCFDCRLGGDAVDLGGADIGRETLKHPATDLAAFVGLQRLAMPTRLRRCSVIFSASRSWRRRTSTASHSTCGRAASSSATAREPVWS